MTKGTVKVAEEIAEALSELFGYQRALPKRGRAVIFMDIPTGFHLPKAPGMLQITRREKSYCSAGVHGLEEWEVLLDKSDKPLRYSQYFLMKKRKDPTSLQILETYCK